MLAKMLGLARALHGSEVRMLKGSGKQRAIQGALLSGAAVAALCALIAFLPARAATPVSSNGIPALMQEPDVAWRAYQFGGRRGPPSRADIPYDKTANEWQAPE